ncbi:hypothetical protein Sjap_021607 [Stephania japonica]|uniref:Probable purine permease n=1 Tax=Stephania japonica TaxID=461633 RepID=A0AAP0EPW5_9MAGN
MTAFMIVRSMKGLYYRCMAGYPTLTHPILVINAAVGAGRIMEPSSHGVFVQLSEVDTDRTSISYSVLKELINTKQGMHGVILVKEIISYILLYEVFFNRYGTNFNPHTFNTSPWTETQKSKGPVSNTTSISGPSMALLCGSRDTTCGSRDTTLPASGWIGQVGKEDKGIIVFGDNVKESKLLEKVLLVLQWLQCVISNSISCLAVLLDDRNFIGIAKTRFSIISLGDQKMASSMNIENSLEEGTTIQNGKLASTAEANDKKKPINWPLLLLSCAFMAIGAIGGPLLSRLYFIHGGSRKWVSTITQTGGCPILFIPLFFLYSRHRSNPQSPHFLIEPKLFFFSAIIGVLLGIDNFLYALGLSYLPVSTSSMLIATQLAFVACFRGSS